MAFLIFSLLSKNITYLNNDLIFIMIFWKHSFKTTLLHFITTILLLALK